MDWHVFLIILFLGYEAYQVQAFLDSIDTECPKQSDFKCTNGVCIDKSKHCDGKADCADGFDELNCGKLIFNFVYYFKKKKYNSILTIYFLLLPKYYEG